MPQINDLIGGMRKNNRAAHAARFMVQFFDEVFQSTTWNFFEVLTKTRARRSKSLIL